MGQPRDRGGRAGKRWLSRQSPGNRPRQPNPLHNPLRAALLQFACRPCGRVDPYGQVAKNGSFLCTGCLAGDSAPPERRAYVSLLYGEHPHYVCGALVLGHSVRASGPVHDRVLLHTSDVPAEARLVLSQIWQLHEVQYIISAEDLHTSPYKDAKFKEVFTKLHVFNPAAVPYAKVVFLDLDTLVLKNIDNLFELRAPAAMCNEKKLPPGHTRLIHPEHGQRMEPEHCYFNAGVMVIAPSRTLFELLASDVQSNDAMWHSGAWSPEQSYLSKVLAGEWSHVRFFREHKR